MDPSFWHITTADRVSSISKNGLVTGKTRRWKNSWGDWLGVKGFIYTFGNNDDCRFHESVQWAGRMHWEFRDEPGERSKIVLIEILDTEGWEEDPEMENGFFRRSMRRRRESVPPNDIGAVIHVDDDLLRTFVACEKEYRRMESALYIHALTRGPNP
jgi:hypothetical protein